MRSKRRTCADHQSFKDQTSPESGCRITHAQTLWGTYRNPDHLGLVSVRPALERVP